jgi:hypothetical protein
LPRDLDEGIPDGVGGGFGAGADAELGEDAGDVVLDRARADEEGIGDLGIGATFDD